MFTVYTNQVKKHQISTEFWQVQNGLTILPKPLAKTSNWHMQIISYKYLFTTTNQITWDNQSHTDAYHLAIPNYTKPQFLCVEITMPYVIYHFGHLNFGQKIHCNISKFTDSRTYYFVKSIWIYKKLIYCILFLLRKGYISRTNACPKFKLSEIFDN